MTEEDSTRYTEADYLCYHLWSRLSSEQKDRDITKTQFWKLVCIAERELQSREGYSTELPRYWYQYGEIPHMSELGIESVFDIGYGEGDSHQSVEMEETLPDSAFEIGGQAKRWIDSVINSLVREYSYSKAWSIKEDHYEDHAPNEFIREFDDFREDVGGFEPNQMSLGFFSDGDNGTTQLGNLKEQLEELVRLYPEEQYETMYPVFLRWEDTVSLLLEQGKVDEAKDLTYSFWQALSKVELRLHHNHNVSPAQIEEWKRKRDVKKNEFEQTLRDTRDDALAAEESTESEITSMAESLSDTLRNTF